MFERPVFWGPVFFTYVQCHKIGIVRYTVFGWWNFLTVG
jgi:hypothetical protein